MAAFCRCSERLRSSWREPIFSFGDPSRDRLFCRHRSGQEFVSLRAPGQGACGEGVASIAGTAAPCLNAGAFLDTFNFLPTAYSTQRRNQYTGPRFFDMDMGLFKTFRVTEGVQLGVGAQAFNVFNHPNFGQPDNGLGDPTFGQINSMQPMPTSPYGVFLGFDSSVRVVQVSGNFIFWPVRLCNRRSRTVRRNRAVPQGIALLLSLRKLLIYPA